MIKRLTRFFLTYLLVVFFAFLPFLFNRLGLINTLMGERSVTQRWEVTLHESYSPYSKSTMPKTETTRIPNIINQKI